MTENQKVDAIIEAAHMTGNDVREYSGRSMYGATCIAVACDYPEDVISEAGVKGALIDDLGRRSIVYWPDIPFYDGRAYRG